MTCVFIVIKILMNPGASREFEETRDNVHQIISNVRLFQYDPDRKTCDSYAGMLYAEKAMLKFHCADNPLDNRCVGTFDAIDTCLESLRLCGGNL